MIHSQSATTITLSARGRMHRSVALAALLMVVLAGSTKAGTMAYEFTGVVDWVDAIGSGGLDPSVHVGTPFAGRFTFDSNAPDSDPASDRGLYTGPGFSMSVDVGSYSWSSGDGAAVGVVNMSGFTFGAGNFGVGDNLWINGITCGFAEPTLAGGALPTEPFALSPSDYFGAKVDNVSFAPVAFFRGPLTTFAIVPEPCCMLLMVGGLISVLIRRR